MTITVARVALRDDAVLKAFVSIVLDEAIQVDGIKVIEVMTRPRIVMPSAVWPDGTYRTSVTLSDGLRIDVEEVVLKAYEEARRGGDGAAGAAVTPPRTPRPPGPLSGRRNA